MLTITYKILLGVNLDEMNYLEIMENPEMKCQMFEERYKIWEQLFPLYLYRMKSRSNGKEDEIF